MSELKNVPKEIYINVGDDEHCEIDFNFDDLTDVTWCDHAIDCNDIKYYLADDVYKRIDKLTELLSEKEDTIIEQQEEIIVFKELLRECLPVVETLNLFEGDDDEFEKLNELREKIKKAINE